MTESSSAPLFNAGAAVYDSFKFLHAAADLAAEKADLVPGEQVLDIACGSGRTTIVAAGLVGESGHVAGIDIADKLLDVAREKTEAAGLSNTDYRVMDAADLDFSDGSFDAVLCGSSLFLFKEIPDVLREWVRVLKPGGRMVITTFGEDIFQPVISFISQRLATYTDVEFPAPVSAVTDTPEKCRDLLEAAGLRDSDVRIEQTEFFADNAEDCWRQVASSLIVRPRLAVLGKDERARMKSEILPELEKLVTPQGIPVTVPVIVSIAQK